MSAMVSRWPVLLVLPIGTDDLDGDGLLTDAACDRLFAAGRTAYFELSKTIDAADVTVLETSPLRRSTPMQGSDEVSISVSVTELFPDSFVMAARVRPATGDTVAADLRCTVSAGEVTPEVRDDLIAIAHAASHMH
jgi:hypothetical protein